MKGVNLIAAVGKSGQLGMNGKLPWYDPEDLKWFRQETFGDVVVFGSKTYDDLPNLDGRVIIRVSRVIIRVSRYLKRHIRLHIVDNISRKPSIDNTEVNITVTVLPNAEEVLSYLQSEFPNKNIWIAGGAQIYELFLPYVDKTYISHIDYDGPADTWMPNQWYRTVKEV